MILSHLRALRACFLCRFLCSLINVIPEKFPYFLITLTAVPLLSAILLMSENTNFKCTNLPLFLFYNSQNGCHEEQLFRKIFFLCEIVRKLFPILFLSLLFASSQLFASPKFILNWENQKSDWIQTLLTREMLKRNQIGSRPF